jgi:hypothetical protein
MNFIPCTICGKKAAWSYMPGDGNYCDKCVPRGCSCNRELKEGIPYDSPAATLPESYYEVLGANGERLPCCEFSPISEDIHNDVNISKLAWDSYYLEHPELIRPDEVDEETIRKKYSFND